MLAEIDLTASVSNKEYKKDMAGLELKLSELTRKAKDLKIPVVFVFEGWSASGKGTLVNRLLAPLDPRLFSVHSITQPNEEESLRPFLWRFWIKLPPKGRMGIFVKSWYKRVLIGRVMKLVKKNVWMRSYQDINNFEALLVDDGAVIIKFWLHISRKQQKERFGILEEDPATAWRVNDDDWVQHKKYDKFLVAAEEMIAKTSTHYAPWTIVESNDSNFAALKIFQTAIRMIEERIEETKKTKSADKESSIKKFDSVPIVNKSILDRVDLTQSISKEEYNKKLSGYQERVRDIQHELYLKRIPMLIVYEGWDAAGKGGNIKRLTANMDPRGYDVVPVAAPNDIERAQHYLWRFWVNMPKAGHISIFDRSWYGRVMVERVEGFCSETDWRKAYKEINDMEEQLVFFGTILIKFWLHIGKDEQLRRFQEREQIPYKKWKITEEDYRNREKWDQYREAVDEMLLRTSTSYAPWTIIESDNKYFARLKALKTVIDAAEKAFENK